MQQLRFPECSCHMSVKKILISGASIAGPTLAFWLNKYGFEVTVVERAESLRLGGQNIDVKGSARTITQHMGIEQEILASNTGEIGVQFVDKNNLVKAAFPKEGATGFTSELEILRGDLVTILYNRTKDNVRYYFGKYITNLLQDTDGVKVSYSDGGEDTFDLVIAADGVRSKTRGLMFGNEAEITYVGLYNAYLTISRKGTDTDWARWYNAPGSRVMALRPDNYGTTRASLSFLSKTQAYQNLSMAGQKQVLKAKFKGAGWEELRFLEEIEKSKDLYFDAVSQVRAPRWVNGRYGIIGDAAYCPTPLTGMGTSLAITGAYLLAGELAVNKNYKQAFTAYENRMRPYVKSVQDLPPGVPWIAHPKTKLGIAVFNTVAGIIAGTVFQKILKVFSGKKKDGNDIELPDYPLSPKG